MPASHYSWRDELLVFNVYLQPQASQNKLVGLYGNAVKITLTSPATGNLANKQLIQFLATLFQVKKTDVTLLSGQQSRRKRLSVSGPSQFPSIFSK